MRSHGEVDTNDNRTRAASADLGTDASGKLTGDDGHAVLDLERQRGQRPGCRPGLHLRPALRVVLRAVAGAEEKLEILHPHVDRATLVGADAGVGEDALVRVGLRIPAEIRGVEAQEHYEVKPVLVPRR